MSWPHERLLPDVDQGHAGDAVTDHDAGQAPGADEDVVDAVHAGGQYAVHGRVVHQVALGVVSPSANVFVARVHPVS